MRRPGRDEASEVSDAATSADESSVAPDDESEVDPSSRSAKPAARPPVLMRREPSSHYSLTTVVLIVALLVAIAWGVFNDGNRAQNCDPRLSRGSLPVTLQSFLNQSTSVPLAFSISCPCFASAISCGAVPIVFPSAGDTFATLLQRAQAQRTHVLIGGVSGKTHSEWFDIGLKQCIDPTVAFSHGISCNKFAFLLENVPDGYYPNLIAEATVHYN